MRWKILILARFYFILLAAFLVFNLPAIAQQTLPSPTPFYFKKPDWLICEANNPSKPIEKFILNEYGAAYLSEEFEGRPKTQSIPCRFEDESAVAAHTRSFAVHTNKFPFGAFYLRPKAKAALENVFNALGGYQNLARNCNVVKRKNLSAQRHRNEINRKCTIVERNVISINNDWATRTYDQTHENWGRSRSPASYVNGTREHTLYNPNLRYRAQKGRRPEMYIHAIPGTSQHHLGIAIDVNDGSNIFPGPPTLKKKCDDICVRRLSENGWFRTVRYDPYHFTFLGLLTEEQLIRKGLKRVKCKDGIYYWVPNIRDYKGIGSWECADDQSDSDFTRISSLGIR